MKDYLKPIFWIRFSLKFPRLYIFIAFKIQTCNHNSTSFTFLSIKKNIHNLITSDQSYITKDNIPRKNLEWIQEKRKSYKCWKFCKRTDQYDFGKRFRGQTRRNTATDIRKQTRTTRVRIHTRVFVRKYGKSGRCVPG